MKRRAFKKLGGQVTIAGTVLTQLSACSSDDDDVRPPNNLDGLDGLDDLGYQGAAPFVHGIAVVTRSKIWSYYGHELPMTVVSKPPVFLLLIG